MKITTKHNNILKKKSKVKTVTKHRAVYSGEMTVTVLYSRGRDVDIVPGTAKPEQNSPAPQLTPLEVAKLLDNFWGNKQVGNIVDTGILTKVSTERFDKYLSKFSGEGLTKSLVKVSDSFFKRLETAMIARPSSMAVSGWTDIDQDGDHFVTWKFTLRPTSP